jgi:hypothetical protein
VNHNLDTIFCRSILVVGGDPTDAMALIFFCKFFHKFLGRVNPIVSMILGDLYSMLHAFTFKSEFGLNGFMCSKALLVMN